MILNRQTTVRLARRPLEQFLRRMKKELGLGRTEITICFVSNGEMARMNQRYRGKRGPTDVLSFPAVQRKNPVRLPRKTVMSAKESWGDVAISPETARVYANKNGRDFSSELKILILHGTLHLLGYDHEVDHGEMDRVEQRFRTKLGLA